jgi:hypothetical protein
MQRGDQPARQTPPRGAAHEKSHPKVAFLTGDVADQ